MAAIMLNSCGSAKQLSSTSYTEEGTGYSMNKDIAFDIARSNALTKISNEHCVNVDTEDKQTYSSTENSRGSSSENYQYNINSKTNSSATVSDYVVVKRKYKRVKKQWECTVQIAVDKDNVE